VTLFCFLPVLTLNCLPRRKSSPLSITSVALCSSEFPVNRCLVQLVIDVVWTYAHSLHYSLCRAWWPSRYKIEYCFGAMLFSFAVVMFFYSKSCLCASLDLSARPNLYPKRLVSTALYRCLFALPWALSRLRRLSCKPTTSVGC
jgi:hypothetical protein